MAGQLTTAGLMLMMMCWTCLHIFSTVSGQLHTTGIESFISKDEADQLVKAAKLETDQKVEDAMKEAKEELGATLSAAIVGLTKRLEELELDNAGLKQDNVAMKQDTISLEQDNVALKYSNVAMEQDIVGLKQQIEGLIAAGPRHDDDMEQVAFSVMSEQDFGPVEVDTNIPFEIILTNIGGNYSPVSHAFQATIPGVYMFTASVKSNTSTNRIHARFVHSHEGGQTILTTMWARDDASVGANSVIVQLAQGDYVSIQLRGGYGSLNSNANRYSTFSGFLLFK